MTLLSILIKHFFFHPPENQHYALTTSNNATHQGNQYNLLLPCVSLPTHTHLSLRSQQPSCLSKLTAFYNPAVCVSTRQAMVQEEASPDPKQLTSAGKSTDQTQTYKRKSQGLGLSGCSGDQSAIETVGIGRTVARLRTKPKPEAGALNQKPTSSRRLHPPRGNLKRHTDTWPTPSNSQTTPRGWDVERRGQQPASAR